MFHHDTPDQDRYDLPDPETRRETNALPEIKDAQALAKALDLSIPRLRWLAFHREVDSGSHYQYWTIPKRDGGARLISAPKPTLKRLNAGSCARSPNACRYMAPRTASYPDAASSAMPPSTLAHTPSSSSTSAISIPP